MLAGATVATALVSEILVHSLDAFGHALGLSEFFVAVVIVAIVGNAAEHGGAIVTARRGNTNLAAEIAISSAAQVAVFVAPAIALLSVSRRPRAAARRSGRSSWRRWAARDRRSRSRSPTAARSAGRGTSLLGLYAVAVVAFGFSGDR